MVRIVILVALYRLIVSVLDELLLESLNPLEPAVFQRIFGGIMTLLIALVRKVIVMDLHETTAASVAALAGLSPEPRSRGD